MNNNNEVIIFKSISDLEKANFYDFLSVMIDWGVTITEALDSVITRIKNPYFVSKIHLFKWFIIWWDSISKSMKKVPDIFNDYETSIIEAWEKSGTLVDSLSNLALDLKKTHELKAKIKTAMTYPIIILLFLVLSVLIVMTYVIPAIRPLFETANVTLPIATQMLISTSDFIWNNIWLLLIVLISIILFITWYRQTLNWKVFFDKLFLNTPLIWTVYKNYILARAIINLWTLLSGWVWIWKTLILVWRSTNNSVYNEIFSQVKEKVEGWQKIVESIIDVDINWEYFTPDYLQMLSVWEKTASISAISKKLHDQYTKEVDISLDNLTKWIEPMAILLAGWFVLWFAFAIFGAILKVTQTIG